MEFTNFIERMQKHFEEMVKDQKNLFEIEVDKDELWNLYLDSFPEGTNGIYRERRVYDCAACKQFIRSIGNAVVIKDNKVETIWDFDAESTTFQPVVNALSAYLKAKAVSNVYVSKMKRIGIDHSHEIVDGKLNTYDHLYLELPDAFVDRSRKSEGDIKGQFRDIRNVFKRSLDEISEDAVLTVLELIGQNSLYRGEEWKYVLNEFLKYKREYAAVSEAEKGNYAWEKSATAGIAVGKIRNHSIGTLLVDINNDLPLDYAVRQYEKIVAPQNYKRPKAIFTKKMLEDAKEKIAELGYMDSLKRRFAKLDDITVNNILFANRDAAKRIEGADVFADMAASIPVDPKKFSRVEEVRVSDFINNILPTAKELEVFLENKHSVNMVSLIAPENKESPSMFKWNNAFGWAYAGNIADSDIKENVKSHGGKVDGALRFSIQWNEKGKDNCDLDAHCVEPGGFEIYFSKAKAPRKSPHTGGQLDVDIVNPRGKVAVENITWDNKANMQKGTYEFFVHQYSGSARKGFRAEIEFDGNIYSFDYSHGMKPGERVQVAKVTLDKDGNFSIDCKLPSEASSKEVWNLNTNQFVPVTAVMMSPNYWDEQTGNGNKHYFFMLKDCVNTEEPNGFYNEYLNDELMQHKHVLEALGSKLAVASADDQLSGVGFSSTKRAELIVKVKGVTERVIKIKF